MEGNGIVIRREKGYTVAEAIVQMNDGLCGKPAMRISEECNHYDGKVILTRKDPEKSGEEYANLIRENFPNGNNGKSIFDLMCLAAAKGVRLEIKVEGENERAERLARRLYNAFRCEDSFNVVFEGAK